ncbi:MAG: hypothetical protein HY000_02795 [Planctomycetes bacterium]|nr:hypothetical protein [Planctomycetota bacterium]
MKLGHKAIATLREWGAFADDRRSLLIEGDKFSIVSEVTAADKMSCSLSHLGMQPRQPAQLTADQLKAWGERITNRVRYLLEAIETVELDAPQGRLLLRSTPPEKKSNGAVLYYELLLETTGQLRLERYRYNVADRTRTPEPLHCTHELLEKLIDDLIASAP